MRKVFPTAPKPLDLSNRLKMFYVGGQRIGDALVQLYIAFLDDRFSFVYIRFKSADFPVMRDAFIIRYGPAHSTTNQSLNWKGPTLIIHIQNYSTTVNNGTASLIKHEFGDELRRMDKEKGKDAAKDL